MNKVFPTSANLIEYSGRSWNDIKLLDRDASASAACGKKSADNGATQLLPRASFPMYGRNPTVDARVYVQCDKCGKVMLPCVFKEHYNHPDHEALVPMVAPVVSPVASPVTKRTRNRKPTKKAAALASPLPAVAPKNVTLILPAMPVTVGPITAYECVGGGGRRKRNAKSNKRSRIEEKPEALPKKASKHDLEHVVAVTSYRVRNSTPTSTTLAANHVVDVVKVEPPPHLMDDDVEDIVVVKDEEAALPPPLASAVTTIVPQRPPAAFIKITASSSQPTVHGAMPQMSVLRVKTHVSDTAAAAIKQEQPSAPQYVVKSESEEAATPTTVARDATASSSSASMAMNPVAVVNIVPVQYLQQYLQLPTQPIVVSIPCTSAATHMYTYPKPLTVSTRAIRKIGNTYLLQNQRLDHQRADIQSITRGVYANTGALNHLPT